ncbi:TPA: restriction endonuclease subunit S [Klebsiella pneumoniae subsp. pneumoniae]|uniref:restriction endonuclease subunit S n=1 Tax=Klebsiella TaxID=570 RepID=UPI000C7BBF48|nr:restriction endonuclease subunit S [Klebsiella pneumoniae]HDU4745039.1 restriction endonuclease subunit S [Klebsiella pneumoniae subsp. pneumoniae]MBD7701596.1 restriction endonuclease subunit S [Klebsiella pneumoniae]MBX4504916.1 restriction endonuclease subunit S [Klebsiella pneumoniae]MCE7442608.1 restriction endonuclease subunit S [Klebsiella pneumoniae]MCE7452684.1 restriction endonuclease subunit S [Klebsiella pneumoniae]
MAKYKAYPEYKDSGVEWLGEIPTSWQMWKLSHAYEVIGSGTTPTSNNESYFQGDIPWVTTGELREKIIYDTDKKVKESTLQIFSALKIHPAGSVVIAMYGATIGRLGILGVDATTNQACCVMTKSKIIKNQYLYYWLQAYRTDIIRLSSGGGQPNINQEKVSSLKVSAPVLNDQTLIVAFLDHETAKIDNLIEKQQQLIELLKEKRQAVISHAVTKGLNPDVPMKDSGVEWLGEVPEHWEVSKFGYISLVVRGGSPRPAGDPTLFNGDYSPWVTVAEITKDNEIYLDSTDTFLTKKGSEQCRVFKAGTLLLSNSGATLGVPKILSIDANANDGVVGFELLNIDHEYAYFYLSTLTTNLRESIKQGSGQPNLNTDIVKSIAIPIPPENEIQRIVSFIKETIKLYSSIESGAMEQVKLLQERRTALISAAVTGKIDVRDWVAPDTQDIEASQEATA